MLQKLLQKWGPILEVFKVRENLKDIMAIYAEHHSKLEANRDLVAPHRTFNERNPYGEEVYMNSDISRTSNCLPIALTLMSKLNVENKELLLVNNAPVVEYNFTFSKDLTDTAFPEDIIKHWITEEAIQKMADELNKQLESKKNFRINMLVSKFIINKVGDNASMTLQGRFSMD